MYCYTIFTVFTAVVMKRHCLPTLIMDPYRTYLGRCPDETTHLRHHSLGH